MNDSFLLHEEDMLKDTHFPVIGYFAGISGERKFIKVIDHLSKGIGYGFDYGCCLFPGDLDDYAIDQGGMFDGVEFSLHSGESVILTYNEFYWYLKKACENYLKKYPSESGTIQSILSKVRTRYNIAK